ncbi:MAG: sensory box histidine kinase PhoR [Acidimicrobiales bacterium]
MSLRRRLVATFVLIALALLAADATVALLVRHSLTTNLDRRLELGRATPRTRFATDALPAGSAAPAGSADAPAPTGTGPSPAPVDAPQRTAVSDLFVALVNPDGSVEQRRTNTIGRHAQPPVLPRDLPTRAAVGGAVPRPFSLPAEGGGPGYRAVAVRTPRGTLVAAVSLRDTLDTVRRVLEVEAATSILVLVALAAGAWWLLRLGVRPLDRMAETADAIAAGDLSRRVELAEPATEAGRLGLALNTMLGEIEHSFAERLAAEERLRRFVADASHELRTPLTSIRGYAELYRQGGLGDSGALADAMRRMEQEAARMGVLVDDMLLLARLDQGRPLESGPVDLGALTADAIADAQAVEPGRMIHLDGPAQLEVLGDEGRLRQVLANLLANTRVHTPASAVVRVGLSHTDTTAVLTVEDDGPGFGAAPERVFERFFRTDPARARARGGTGLGLAIVDAIVGAHGGTARAGSSTNGGARVTIELPLSHVPPPPPPECTPRSEFTSNS